MEAAVNESWTAIDIATDDHVATVTLKGPGKGNALGPEVWEELPRAFDELSRAENVRAVVIKGSGDNFSYGLDLHNAGDLMTKLMGEDNLARQRLELLDLIEEWQRAFDAIESCRKPVVAMIDGWCIGGGIDLIAACDVRFASDRATFSLREVKLAIVPDLGSLQRLPALIGEGQTRRLALSGEDIDAAEAAQIGLVEKFFPADELEEATYAWANEVAGNPPLVVQGIKQVMNRRRQAEVRTGLDDVATWNSAFLQSHDLEEAMMAFLEGRKPEFKGE